MGDSEQHSYFAVAAPGVEPAAAAELARLGAGEIRPVPGGVHFIADRATLYRALLWLRTVSRVLKPLREFAAVTPEMLYSQTRRVPWEELLDLQQTFAVQATIQQRPARDPASPPSRRPERGSGKRRGEDHGKPRGIEHSMYAALKIKDALCDRMRHERGARPNVDRNNPDLLLHAHFSAGRCLLSLDAAGTSLHQRGYRTPGAQAPLKETLAAAIVELTGWTGDVPLYDPCCGSGTLVIEAALAAMKIAPGLSGREFACHRWRDFDATLWQEVVHDAQRQRRAAALAPLFGSDADPQAVDAARQNARRAGVQDVISWSVGDAADARPPSDAPGVIVTNPPYGRRLGDARELAGLYRALGRVLAERFGGWTAWVLAGNLSLARGIALPATEKIKLYNGPLVCRLLKFVPSDQSAVGDESPG